MTPIDALPEVALYSTDGDTYKIYEVERAAKRLNMQCYALALLDLFEKHENLSSFYMQVDRNDRFVALEDVKRIKGMGRIDLDALDLDVERINDLRDDGLYTFIDLIAAKGTIKRGMVNARIEEAYDQIVQTHVGAPTWAEVSARREALLLEAATAISQCKPTQARM